MRKGSVALVVIFIFIAMAGCTTQEKHAFIFKGVELHFRGDLNKAAKIPVYPDESLIPEMVLSEKIEKITIAIPNVTKAGYYAVAGYEIAYKLTFIYNSIYSPFSNPEVSEEKNYTCLYYKDFEKKICIGRIIFNKYENLKGESNETVIILLGEGLANATEITLKPEKHVILIKGKSFSQENRKYTDLDLAVDRFLLVLFEYLANGRV